MSLIVETGAIVAGAESLLSVADATTYHANRGNSTWATITTAQQEQALRRASDYLEQVYSQSWKGLRVNNVQALSWPRSGVVVNYYSIAIDAIPVQLINATAELALKAASGELAADLTRGVIREKIDSIEVEYDKYSTELTRYTAIENLLRPLLANQSSVNVALVRA